MYHPHWVVVRNTKCDKTPRSKLSISCVLGWVENEVQSYISVPIVSNVANTKCSILVHTEDINSILRGGFLLLQPQATRDTETRHSAPQGSWPKYSSGYNQNRMVDISTTYLLRGRRRVRYVTKSWSTTNTHLHTPMYKTAHRHPITTTNFAPQLTWDVNAIKLFHFKCSSPCSVEIL